MVPVSLTQVNFYTDFASVAAADRDTHAGDLHSRQTLYKYHRLDVHF